MIILNETRKGLIILWQYKANTIGTLAIVCFIFIGVGFLVGNGRLEPSLMSSALLGYIVWYYAFLMVADMGAALLEETQTGTLEQVYMSPSPPELMLLGRVLSTLIVTTITGIIMVLLMVLLLDLNIPLRWEGAVILIITLVGVIGFGFMIAGITLVFKHVTSITGLLQNALAFLNGTFIPVENFPIGLKIFANSLPTTEGIVLIRNVLLDDHSLSTLANDGRLSWLILHSTLYLVSGWIIFKFCELKAKKHGTLGQY